jgi:hypothetical protein
VRPSLEFREVLPPPKGGLGAPLPLRELFAEVHDGDEAGAAQTFGKLSEKSKSAFGDMTERASRLPSGEIVLVDGTRELWRFRPARRITSDEIELRQALQAVCTTTEQRRVPDDISVAVASAPE